MQRLILALVSTALAGIAAFAAVPPAARPASQPATSSRPTVLTPGDHALGLTVDGLARTYLVHVPPGYDRKQPAPVVLALHGGRTNAKIMQGFCGLDKKADAAGFLVVYPDGQGQNGRLFYNTWGGKGPLADDVKFIAAVLDDVCTLANVDAKRVFATGISDGAMMSYLLAAELSDRIAAIAPVSGTVGIEKIALKRPVPILHFHGTADTFVPYGGPQTAWQKMLKMQPVEETIRAWAKLDGCPDQPQTTSMPSTVKDGTTVTRKVYGPGKDGAEVVLFVIDGGGHTWPGLPPAGRTGFAAGRIVETFLGKSTGNLAANDLMWDFFCKHPMK